VSLIKISFQKSRPIPTNVLRPAELRRTCTNFNQDSFKIKRLVCIERDRQKERRTDGQTAGHRSIDSPRRLINNTYNLWDLPPSTRNTFCGKIIIRLVRV